MLLEPDTITFSLFLVHVCDLLASYASSNRSRSLGWFQAADPSIGEMMSSAIDCGRLPKLQSPKKLIKRQSDLCCCFICFSVARSGGSTWPGHDGNPAILAQMRSPGLKSALLLF